MIRFRNPNRLAGLLLAALIITGCGAPADTPTTIPTFPPAAAPTGYPAPAAAPTGYPAPAAAPTGYPEPYPEPTQSGNTGGDPMALAIPPGDAQDAMLPASTPAPRVAQGIQSEAILNQTPVTRASVVAAYPHDRQAYTQGLVYVGDDTLFEGTGLYGASSLRKVDLVTGAVLRQVNLGDVAPPLPNGGTYFGEGIAVVGDWIFQLTWRECKGFIYDLDFTLVDEFTYPRTGDGSCATEGWGLAYDGERLIMSNGTATLYVVDPAATASTGALAIIGQIEVYDHLGPVTRLNELEVVGDEIFANIWFGNPRVDPDWIARIDPATGRVNGFIDLGDLRAALGTDPNLPPPEALNGIAYDAANDRLFVTGKRWPSLFEVDLPVARAFLPIAAIVPPASLPRLWS